MNPSANSWILMDEVSREQLIWANPVVAVMEVSIEVEAFYTSTPIFNQTFLDFEGHLANRDRKELIRLGAGFRVCSPGTHDSKARIARRIMVKFEELINPTFWSVTE
jgi:hypothetical protein